MAEKKLEGLWDCPYCGQKGIGGLKKHCPGCGHPQDEGTKFYLGEEKTYLSEETAAKYGKGADWTCAYCGSMNRYDADTCSNCGAPREETTGNYFENQKKNEEAAKKKEEELNYYDNRDKEVRTQIAARKRKLGCGIVAAILAIILIVTLIPKNKTASVSEKSWSRVIYTETFTAVTEKGWELPDGARPVESHEEIHHYVQVPAGYTEQPVDKTREVFDGYDSNVVYHDNGDGTFTEEVVQTERYVTEHYTEYVTVPVYADEPVYQTAYTYEVDRWVDGRTVKASGTEDTPVWPELTLAENEREARRTETYTLGFSTGKKGGTSYTANVPESVWNSCSVGKGVDITVTSGSVTEIDGVSIR